MSRRPVPPLDLLGDESWWTFGSCGAYAERLARERAPVNTYALIGEMSLRVEALGGDTGRAATDGEAERMRARLGECLAASPPGPTKLLPPRVPDGSLRGVGERRSS